MRTIGISAIMLAADPATFVADWKRWGTELLLSLLIIAMFLVAVWGLILV
ncbi:hypothetical protein [Bradyrhizobium sp. LMTR 3]|nr:hypothetical protein [Bradyrhizobium sp. LMTR 3]